MVKSKSILVVGFLLLLVPMVHAATTEYNFSVQTNIWAWQEQDCDAGSAPPSDGPDPTCGGSHADITSDAALDSSDDIDVQLFVTPSDEDYFVFRVNVQESRASITNINFSTESAGDLFTRKMYIWNFTSTGWILCEGDAPGPDIWLECDKSSGFTDLINSTGDLWVVFQLATSLQAGTIYLDYARLQVEYTINAPNVTTPIISPSTAYTISNLTANTTYTSPSNNIGNITFNWYKDNLNIYNQSFNDQTTGTVLNSTLGSGNFTHFDLINVSVQATDSAGANSSIVFSTQINISNTAPTISTAYIDITSPTTNDNLTCNTTGANDIDSDSLTYYYNWFKNDVAQNINNVVLGSGNTSVSEIWKCTANVSDSYNYSSIVTSAGVSIATGFLAPTINSTNATTALTNILSTTSNPTNNNSWVNLSIDYYDNNTLESHTIYFCKTDSADLTGCLGGQFCASPVNNAPKWTYSCKYNVSTETATSKDYWVYIVDSGGLISSSTQGIFYLNYPPTLPTISAPANDSWVNTNYTLIQFSATDPDSDTITYHVYGNTSANPTNLINSTTTNFNWTGLNETNYYVRVIANDSHGYESAYSIDTYFKVDYTAPVLANDSVSYPTLYVDILNTIQVNCSDYGSGVNTAQVDYNITTPLGTTSWQYLANVSTDIFRDIYTPLGTVGTYNIDYFRCYDLAGNIGYLDSALNFTTLARTPAGSPGGPSSPIIQVQSISDEELQAQLYNLTGPTCGNNICEQGESPANCLKDCVLPIDSIFTCIFSKDEPCSIGSWFATVLIYTIMFSIAYFIVVSEYKKKKGAENDR